MERFKKFRHRLAGLKAVDAASGEGLRRAGLFRAPRFKNR
jgi:hypothetical protein